MTRKQIVTTTTTITKNSLLQQQEQHEQLQPMKTLVVGGTGNTGKHVVRKLLDLGYPVRVVVRSKEKMLSVLPPRSTTTTTTVAPTTTTTEKNDKTIIQNDELLLSIVEVPSLVDMDETTVDELVRDVENVIFCLGHTMTFSGMYGHPRQLVTDVTKLVTQAMIRTSSTSSTTSKKTKTTKKFILMSSDGVINPMGTDNPRTYLDRTLLFIIRYLVPPHADNEQAAQYLYNNISIMKKDDILEWIVLRPVDLVDDPPPPSSIITESNDEQDHHPNEKNGITKTKSYTLYPKSIGTLFQSGTVTRCNVAQCMVDMILNHNDNNNHNLWNEWKFQFPVIHDSKSTTLKK